MRQFISDGEWEEMAVIEIQKDDHEHVQQMYTEPNHFSRLLAFISLSILETDAYSFEPAIEQLKHNPEDLSL